MPEQTYILCPGQGAQVVGMGKDYYDASPKAREVFSQADKSRWMNCDISDICFGGPEEILNKTNISQPALYVTGVACFHAAVEAGTIDPTAALVYAGLSLGEYTALHLAGVFTFEDGLRLVSARGQFMQEAAEAVPSGMVAIMGGDETAITALCEEAAGGEVLVPANFNAPGQIVVSGSKAACSRALAAAEAKGLKAVELKVAGAFHSPLMQPAADRMRAELDQVDFKEPARPVYANVSAQPHGDAASIKDRLVQQIVAPVRWEQTMQTLVGQSPEGRYIELAPGRTLAGLMKRISRRLPIENLASADALKA